MLYPSSSLSAARTNLLVCIAHPRVDRVLHGPVISHYREGIRSPRGVALVEVDLGAGDIRAVREGLVVGLGVGAAPGHGDGEVDTLGEY